MTTSSWVVAFLYVVPYFITILFIFYKSRIAKVDSNRLLRSSIGSIHEDYIQQDIVSIPESKHSPLNDRRLSNDLNHQQQHQKSQKYQKHQQQHRYHSNHHRNSNESNSNNNNNNNSNEDDEDDDDDPQLHRRQSSGTVDLTKLHDISHTSTWQGTPSTLWQSFIALLHSFDTGLHLGLIAHLIENSHGWNISQQYLFAALWILIFYRVSSFVVIWLYLPRYSYTKTVSGNRALLANTITLSGPNVQINRTNPTNTVHYKYDSYCHYLSYLNYCWLQLLFDAGYLLELAPWLLNWDYTRILIPEFAWFCKVRSLTESFPFCLLIISFLMYRENNLLDSGLHSYALISCLVSLACIIMSLWLYDETSLALDVGVSYWKIRIYNTLYRCLQPISRILVLAFLIALFPWWVLFLIIIIPLAANYIPFKLGRTDNEPYNFIYQSLLAFPDYSAPFGRISNRDNFLNHLNRFQYIVLAILGSPLTFVRMFVEAFSDKFLKINKKSTNLEEYASYVITTYTISRFVESIFELIFIGAQIYGSDTLDTPIDMRSGFTLTFYWLAVIFTLLFLVVFFPIRYEFVKDNLADETKALAASKAGKAAFVQTNEEYNTSKTGANSKRNSRRTSDPLANIALIGLDGKSSRQGLLQRQFWRAIHRNNYKELGWLLRSRQHLNLFQLNEQDEIGIIVLGLRYDWACVKLMAKNGGGLRHLCRYAASHGDIEILRFVHTQLGIDITTLHDEFDELLLFSAVEGSQPSVVQMLADFNADLAVKSLQGDSALILASQKGDKEIVQLLNERGLEIGITDEHGNNIAHYAAMVFNGKNILEYLVSKYGDEFRRIVLSRRDSNVSDADNETTIVHTSKRYTGGFNFDAKNESGATPAYNAAWKGQTQNLEILANVGCNLDMGNEDGNTPLIAAAMTDQPACISFLIDRGCEVNQTNKGEETSLYWAAYNCCSASIEVLLEKGANIEKCDKYGNTPLLVASDHGEVKAVRILLKYNANVNHQNQIGETALMKACAEGHLECVQELVKASGCNKDLRDDEGNAALLWTCMTGQMEVFAYLVDYWKITKEEIVALQNNDEETCIDWIVENKLERGIEILKKLGVEISGRENSQSRSKSHSQE